MSRAWSRAFYSSAATTGTYGGTQLITLTSGQTAMHSFWNINVWGTWGSVAQYPPGSSLMRAGLVVAASGLAGDANTPISQPSADWMDITTICPVGQIATSTNVDWQYNWQLPVDRDVVVQRKNSGTTSLGIYVAWEFVVASDAVSGFSMGGWSASIDTYINTP